jgi:hypothetical protein
MHCSQGEQDLGEGLINVGRAMKQVTVDTATRVVTAPGVEVIQFIQMNIASISGAMCNNSIN